MQKLTNGVWVHCVESDLVDGDIYRISVGGTGWQQQAYSEPIILTPIIITGITGAESKNTALTHVTCYELTTITVTGTLAIPDRVFAMPVRREDGRTIMFLAEVISGSFTVQLNFSTSGVWSYSDTEANKDLPEPLFTVDKMKFDVLRKVTL
jgi:hypothetical protein